MPSAPLSPLYGPSPPYRAPRKVSKIIVADTWLREGNTASPIVSRSTEALKTTQPRGPESITLEPVVGRRRGIVGRAMATGCTLRIVTNLKQDSDYVECHSHAQSELVVPIKIADEVIAAINLEHSDEHAFDQEDEQIVQALAAQASVAIQNARHTRLIVAKTQLVWMNMASGACFHAIGNHATAIGDEVQLLRHALAIQQPVASLRLGLENIERRVADIHTLRITAPLATEEGVNSICIYDLLQERLRRLWSREPYTSVSLYQRPLAEPGVRVRVSAEWFTRALDIVIDNAIEAMTASRHRSLTIMTRVSGNRLEISVYDTGPGIAPEIQEHLLKHRIPKPPGAKGFGVGLLMAQTILQTYGGDIRLGSTGPEGTTMILWLPLEEAGEAPKTLPVGNGDDHRTEDVNHFSMPQVSHDQHRLREFLLVGNQRTSSWLPIVQGAASSLAVLRTVSAEHAPQHVAQRLYDLILIDATDVAEVPTLVTALRKRQPDARILVGTAAQDWTTAREVLRAGALDYLDKAMAADELRLLFQRILAAQRDPYLGIDVT